MAYSATILSTDRLSKIVQQTSHGFDVGDIVRFNGTNFVAAQADNELHAEVVGMVSFKYDANRFAITQTGFVSNLVNGQYAEGHLYYLSVSNPGELQPAKPTAVGEVELPCFIPYTTTSGYFFGSVGTLITSGALFAWTPVIIDTLMTVNNGYQVNGLFELNLTLPSVCAVGDIVRVATVLTNGVRIKQNADQYIQMIDVTTQNGTMGSLHLLTTNGVFSGALELVCTEANKGWSVISGNGTWDVI